MLQPVLRSDRLADTMESMTDPQLDDRNTSRRGPVPRRTGGGGVYDRRRQKAAEYWPPPARFNAWLFRHPEILLRLLGKAPAIVNEGRVLNRSAQAMLETVSRLQGFGPSGESGFDQTAIRKQLVRMAVIAMPVRTDVHVAGCTIPSTECPEGSDGIPIRVYRRFGVGVEAGLDPTARPPAIVYFHGGGWISGDLRSHDASCRLLAAVSGCIVVAVDYRLAPEHPYPAAVEDATAAYAWVCRHAGDLGIAEGKVGVMGDSAGGNLAAVVALRTRQGGPSAEPGLPAPVAQGLIYPSVCIRIHPRSKALDADYFLTAESMVLMRDAYVPNESDWDDPSVSPIMADDLTGVAPALVVTAGFDPLHYDGDAYASRLSEAGVAVDFRHYPDQIHGFFGIGILADSLALSIEVCDAMGRLMRRHAHDDG